VTRHQAEPELEAPAGSTPEARPASATAAPPHPASPMAEAPAEPRIAALFLCAAAIWLGVLALLAFRLLSGAI
jgi:hypothetical protein